MDDLMVTVKVRDRQLVHKLDRFPDECPICHKAGVQVRWSALGNFIQFGRAPTLQVVYQCPSQKCSHLYIAHYVASAPPKVAATEETAFYLGVCLPSSMTPRQTSHQIEEASPQFAEIYNQAARAEQLELMHICGPGYRKALEFLIKDYLVNVRKIDQEAVANKFLGTCIKDYLGDTKVAVCAERAAWLGNDETHYVRKWADKDLQDLKTLIELTVHWIETEMLTDEYKSQMQT